MGMCLLTGQAFVLSRLRMMLAVIRESGIMQDGLGDAGREGADTARLTCGQLPGLPPKSPCAYTWGSQKLV